MAQSMTSEGKGCTCRWGRDTDGSEFGPCEWCEEQAWRTENGLHDEDFEAMLDGRTELTAEERFAALAEMGEPEGSRELCTCGKPRSWPWLYCDGAVCEWTPFTRKVRTAACDRRALRALTPTEEGSEDHGV